MPKYSVMIARQPFKRAEDPDVTDWLIKTVVAMKADSRISEIHMYRKDDTPATMVRNDVVEKARAKGVDYLLIVDNDMNPDAYHASNEHRLGVDPGAKKFWDSSWEFMLEHPEPCIIAAPYCGPPPHECVYVFRWISNQSDHPAFDRGLQMFSREDAAHRHGIEEVAALPTGLMLLNMKVFEALDPPYFCYEWTDQTESKKASTEDVFFTRDLSIAGIPNYCNWDAWAGHWKMKCVGKPWHLTVESIREEYRAALGRAAEREQVIVLPERKPIASGPKKRKHR